MTHFQNESRVNTSRHILDDFSFIPEKCDNKETLSKLSPELLVKDDPVHPQFANILSRPQVLILRIQPEQQLALKPPMSMLPENSFNFSFITLSLSFSAIFLTISKQTSVKTETKTKHKSMIPAIWVVLRSVSKAID
jgi:hypothetical protein